MDRVLINPPAASLGRANAIVGGRSRGYEAENVEGALPIKCVVDGVATWGDHRRPVRPRSRRMADP